MAYPLLILQIIDAKGLAAKDTVVEIKTTGPLSLNATVDTIKTSDPFAKAIFLNSKGKVLYEDKTEVVQKNLNPIWGWNTTPFSGDQVPEATKKKLAEELSQIRIEVWDHDKTTNDFLGQCLIPIDKDKIRLAEEHFNLQPRTKADKDIKGKIKIDLNYKTGAVVAQEKKEAEEQARREAAAKKEAEEKARISAIIERENKLKEEQAQRQKEAGGSAIDNPINFMIRPVLALLLQHAVEIEGKDTITKKDPATGKTTHEKTSDPYCWVRFYGAEERLIYEEKTEVIKETVNPLWNFKIEPFENFAVSEETKDKIQAELKNIQIQLYDHDRFLRDDFLGQVVLDLAGKEKVVMDDEKVPLEGKKKKGGQAEKTQGTLVLTFTYKTSQQVEREAKEAKELALRQKREAEEKAKREAEEKTKKKEKDKNPTSNGTSTGGSGSSSSSSSSAADHRSGKTKVSWVDDSKRPNCNVCGSGFSFLNRRHHCRACGEVICGDCSSKNKEGLLWCKNCHKTPPNTYADN